MPEPLQKCKCAVCLRYLKKQGEPGGSDPAAVAGRRRVLAQRCLGFYVQIYRLLLLCLCIESPVTGN